MAAAATTTTTASLRDLNLCDDCHSHGQAKATTADVMTPSSTGGMKAQPQQMPKQQQQIVLHEDEDGYCELVEVTGRDRRRRSSSINKPDVVVASQQPLSPSEVAEGAKVTTEEGREREEVNEDEGGGESFLKSALKLKEQLLSSSQSVPLNLIAANVLALNQTITKLLVSKG